MKIIVLLLITFLLFSCKEKIEVTEDEIITDLLRIYTYDDLVNNGLAAAIIDNFERKYDCSVIITTTETREELLDLVIGEKDDLFADIVIGIPNTQLNEALASNLFMVYEAENLKNIGNKTLLLDRRYRLTPFNYSYFAFVYDTEIVQIPPYTFAEMTSSVWRDRIILKDPNTSAIGYGLLLWTLGIWGERGFDGYWERLSNNVFSIQPSRFEAYTAFQIGEAPIILSNSTRHLYFNEVENNNQYSAFIPEEGGFKEIEFAGIIQGSKNLYLARRFIEFLLTADVQQHIPTTQWMYPVIDDITLPTSFASAPRPRVDLTEKIFARPDNFSDRWIEQWTRTMAK